MLTGRPTLWLPARQITPTATPRPTCRTRPSTPCVLAAPAAQSNALIEDYVELIADLLQSTREARTTDIARRFGVSHPTAIKNIARLKSAGLVESRPYRGVF